jgi:tetratricopeptide (TPR) repeat protein
MRRAGARLIACLVVLVTLSACARDALKPAVVVSPGPSPTERLAVADRLVRVGCLDCLLEAYREYQALRSVASAGQAATLGAIRAAGLIALRQRELGMADEGYLAAAKALSSSTPDLPAWMAGTLDIVDALGGSIAGVSRPPSSDADLESMRVRRTNRQAYTTLLRDFSEVDELSAYTWAAFMCGAVETRDVTAGEIFAAVSTFRDTPLIAFKQATCRGVEPEPLRALTAAEPRFAETAYLLGLVEVGRQKLDEADAQFARAYAWRPRWPALTQSMANVAMTAEEFAKALRLYDETLDADPRAADALLGKIRALTYLGKAVEAIASVDQLLGERWYLGDARYWRALNENQLERYEDAWSDVGLADKLLINAEVPKLAGIIAYRRHDLDVSRTKFDLSRQRNRDDCETGFYLGLVLAEQRSWATASDVFLETCACIERAEHDYTEQIAAIRSSSEPEDRKARKIATREQLIANGRRQMATSWFNLAVASYNLVRTTDARQYAEKVANDEQFGERAREILARLGK